MFSTYKRMSIYILLFFLVMINYMDRVNMSVASKPIATQLHLSPGLLGLLFSSFLWIYIVMLVPSGVITDRLGTRKTNALSITIWSIASMLTGAMSTFSTMVLCRLGMGLGESATYPVCARIINEWAPASERGRATSIYNSGAYAGPAFGAIFVAWLVSVFGWRTSFYITGAIGFVWLIIWLLWFRQPEDAKWLTDVERHKILSERGMSVRDDSDIAKVRVRELLKCPSMWGVAITQGCAVYTQYLFLTWLPNYLETVRHLSIMKSGVVTALPYLFAVILGIGLGFVSDRLLTSETRTTGTRRLAVVVSMLISAVVLLTPIVQSITLIVVLITISLTCISTAVSLNIALTNDLLRVPSHSGKANSLLIFGGNIFGFLAPIITGYVIEFTGHYSGAFIIAGILLIFGATTALTLTRRPIAPLTQSKVDSASVEASPIR